MPMTGEQLASHLSKLMTHDAYSVSNSDNPNTSLTQSLFDGTNYINWSRQFRLGLGTKDKLGFIDGGITKPEENATDFAKWLRSDRLVGCWILSSMAPEIAQSFVYNTSAKDLWDEVQERYAQSNASLLYQLKMELMRVIQGGMTVTQYFNKLRKIWDDIQSLNGIPMCSCGNMAKCSCKILKRIQDLEAQDRLLHFLINLSPEFDITKNQILSTIPMPSLNSAYQLVLQVESQKQITAHNAGTGDLVAFLAGSQNTANIGAGVTNSGAAAQSRKDWKRVVNDRKLCSLCNMKGHLAESYFEVIGYPDWYKGKKGKRGNKMVAGAMADDTPIQVENISSSSKHTNLDPDFLNSIYQEVYKMIKGSAGQVYSGCKMQHCVALFILFVQHFILAHHSDALHHDRQALELTVSYSKVKCGFSLLSQLLNGLTTPRHYFLYYISLPSQSCYVQRRSPVNVSVSTELKIGLDQLTHDLHVSVCGCHVHRGVPFRIQLPGQLRLQHHQLLDEIQMAYKASQVQRAVNI